MERTPMAGGHWIRAARLYIVLSLRPRPRESGMEPYDTGRRGRGHSVAGDLARLQFISALLQFLWRYVWLTGSGDHSDAVALPDGHGSIDRRRGEFGDRKCGGTGGRAGIAPGRREGAWGEAEETASR